MDSSDQSVDPIREHFLALTDFANLKKKTQDEFFNWVTKSRPFSGIQDFGNQLNKSKIKGIKPTLLHEIVGSLEFRFSRRPFLSMLGGASLLSLGIGLLGKSKEEHESLMDRSYTARDLLAAIQQAEVTVGQSVKMQLENRSDAIFTAGKGLDSLGQFIHSLDMSNWMRASSFLEDQSIKQILSDGLAASPYVVLIDALIDLQNAWQYLNQHQAEWQDDYFVAYAFGKMAALSVASLDEEPHPSFSREAAAYSENIYRSAPLFYALEMLNQRFQRPGKTAYGAPIRCTQGHNFSFAHFSEELSNQGRSEDGKPTVLVNWDAHADLGEAFDNPRMPLQEPFDQLMAAKSYAEKVAISSGMSIAGWILPLIYQGLLTDIRNFSQIVWVVPEEAQSTSKGYMEPYGSYTFVVGDWLLPVNAGKIQELSTVKIGDWNVPGSHEIRRYSDYSTLQSVAQVDLLNNQRECELHIVSPSNIERMREVFDGTHIALSVDADYTGTREPGIRPRKGFLPHYPLTENEKQKKRHQELLSLFGEFYKEFSPQVTMVSIANSPNFTVLDEVRKPVSRILEIVANESKTPQPDWLLEEVKRNETSSSSQQTALAENLLNVGGIAGLGIAVGLLGRDWQRLKAVRRILFS